MSVESPAEAEQALAHFNRFHDAFIRRFALEASPESGADFGFALPVHYEVSVVLNHSNYGDQVARDVELRLHSVQRLGVGNVVALDPMLQEVKIGATERGFTVDLGGDGTIVVECERLTISGT